MIDKILARAGCKKRPRFSVDEMRKIQASIGPVNESKQGFILCPFGSNALPDKDVVRVEGGLIPSCPVHGDKCPGLKKIN